MKNRRTMKLRAGDRGILAVGYTLLGLFAAAVLIPLAYVVIASFMDPNVLNNQGISLHVEDWTMNAYSRVLKNKMIWRGFLNSFFYINSIYIDFRIYYPSGGLSYVEKGTGGTKAF